MSREEKEEAYDDDTLGCYIVVGILLVSLAIGRMYTTEHGLLTLGICLVLLGAIAWSSKT